MKLKYSKSQVLANIMARVWSQLAQYDPLPIEHAVSNAMYAGFKELLDSMYTDEEFEQDVGLNNPDG